MTQLNLLDGVTRSERPWKVARKVSRAAFLDAEERGQLKHRREIVGRYLRYIWNSTQRSATSRTIAKWIYTGKRDWTDREWYWILYETRRALTDLRAAGLADTKENKIGREYLWRWREAATGERPIQN